MATYQCSDELHGGVPTTADYFAMEVDDTGDSLMMGDAFAGCEEHFIDSLKHLTRDDGRFVMVKVRRVTDHEKAEFQSIQDQLKAVADEKAANKR